MWVNYVIIVVDMDLFIVIKKILPCILCNYKDQTYIYLKGQIWVDDDYEPISEPDEPN